MSTRRGSHGVIALLLWLVGCAYFIAAVALAWYSWISGDTRGVLILTAFCIGYITGQVKPPYYGR